MRLGELPRIAELSQLGGRHSCSENLLLLLKGQRLVELGAMYALVTQEIASALRSLQASSGDSIHVLLNE